MAQSNGAQQVTGTVTLTDPSGYPLSDSRSAPIHIDQTVLERILEELRLIRLTLADIGDTTSSDLMTDELPRSRHGRRHRPAPAS